MTDKEFIDEIISIVEMTDDIYTEDRSGAFIDIKYMVKQYLKEKEAICPMISVVQYYPFKSMYGAACIIDSFADKRYSEFLELVNAKDPEHYSIVIHFWGKDWRNFFDVCDECKKALNCVCK